MKTPSEELCNARGMAGLVVLSWTGYREQIAERQTHFMSWTWRYALAEMRSALEMYRVSVAPAIATDSVFFFMCFFVNNQCLSFTSSRDHASTSVFDRI